ncbi:hypothetical protein BKA14_000001, partial [Actinoplanes abujensis]|nr:hypothetical protein [Actinoplanes abujensis]
MPLVVAGAGAAVVLGSSSHGSILPVRPALGLAGLPQRSKVLGGRHRKAAEGRPRWGWPSAVTL